MAGPGQQHGGRRPGAPGADDHDLVPLDAWVLTAVDSAPTPTTPLGDHLETRWRRRGDARRTGRMRQMITTSPPPGRQVHRGPCSTRVAGMSVITSARARSTSSAAASGSAAADRRAFLDGVRAMLPLLLGVAPFGLVIGVTVAELGVPHLAGWSLGWLVYAGSAQLAAVGLLAGSASAGVVVASVAVINLRLALYSAAHGSALAGYQQGVAAGRRLPADRPVVRGRHPVLRRLAAPATGPPALPGRRTGAVGRLAHGDRDRRDRRRDPAARSCASSRSGRCTSSRWSSWRPGPTAARVGVAVAAVTAVVASLLPLHLGPAVGMAAGLLAGSLVLRRSA